MNSKVYRLIVFVVSFYCAFILEVEAQNLRETQSTFNAADFSSNSLATASYKRQEPSLNANNNNQNDILVLMPASLNLSTSNSLIDPQSSLFKLDTDTLLNHKNHDGRAEADDSADFSGSVKSDLSVDGRTGRKMNFLRGMWNKPKMSPLYLINGTVCRFVNSLPICTTLSTTGLLANNNTSSSTSSVFNGGGGQVQLQPLNSNQQFQNNNQQQQYLNNNNNNQQFQNQQQFANNQLNRAQPRPLALMDDEPQDMNVESSINVTEISPTKTQPQQQQTSSRPTNNQHATIQGNVRPVSLMMNRRPLNLLSLRRPVRQGLQIPSGRSNDQS